MAAVYKVFTGTKDDEKKPMQRKNTNCRAAWVYAPARWRQALTSRKILHDGTSKLFFIGNRHRPFHHNGILHHFENRIPHVIGVGYWKGSQTGVRQPPPRNRIQRNERPTLQGFSGITTVCRCRTNRRDSLCSPRSQNVRHSKYRTRHMGLHDIRSSFIGSRTHYRATWRITGEETLMTILRACRWS